MIKAGVIGHPIKHSKSPIIHNYWIDIYKKNGSYEALDIALDNLGDEIKRLIDEGYAGFNITIPHKEAIMEHCDDIAHNAEAIGAVNTVTIKDGKLHGLNTDGFGFTHNIWDSETNFEFEGKCAVLLGAGGATRAVTSALIGEEIEQIIITNRTRERAEKIKDEMGFLSNLIKVVDWDDRSSVLSEADLLVNTTSLGMDGQPALDIDLNGLKDPALVNDIVYAPLETPLLSDAVAKGHKTVTGIGMLIHQARPAFKEWFGLLPDVTDDLRGRVLR